MKEVLELISEKEFNITIEIDVPNVVSSYEELKVVSVRQDSNGIVINNEKHIYNTENIVYNNGGIELYYSNDIVVSIY